MQKSYNNLQTTVCSSMSRSSLPIPAKHFSNTHLQNLSLFDILILVQLLEDIEKHLSET
jgi:hypothetical protein